MATAVAIVQILQTTVAGASRTAAAAGAADDVELAVFRKFRESPSDLVGEFPSQSPALSYPDFRRTLKVLRAASMVSN